MVWGMSPPATPAAPPIPPHMPLAGPVTPEPGVPGGPDDPRVQSRGEEWANILTHGAGLLLAVAGAAVAVTAASLTGSAVRIVTVSIFVTTLIMVYLASTGFHMTRDVARRGKWRLFDHLSIYCLIAGSYSPVLLVSIGGAWGWSLFCVVWTLAATGIVAKTLLVGKFDRFERIDTFLYLAMGWLVVVAIVPLWAALSLPAIGLLALGGVFYSGGCVFFLWDQLPYNHSIWHLFVLGGSVCHYLMILHFVVPLA